MKRLLPSLLFLAAASLAPGAENASLTGDWKVHLSIAGTENDQLCTFTEKDGTLTGTCKGDQSSVTITGKTESKKVTWQFNTEYNGDPLTVVCSGTVESPTSIVGTVDVQPMGVSGDFTATQSK